MFTETRPTLWKEPGRPAARWRQIGESAPVQVGQRFGSWSILSAPFQRDLDVKRTCYVFCRCTNCGNDYWVNWFNLVNNKTSRCNTCAIKKSRAARDIRAWGRVLDANDLILRRRWIAMMRRCYDAKSRNYQNYGGRGVKVYPSFHSVVCFADYCRSLPDRPERLTRKDTIDRIDVSQDYVLGNIRFAS